MDGRVSVKSLGLSCITAALDMYPYTCITLEFVESYLSAKDPKLRSQAVMVRKCGETKQKQSSDRETICQLFPLSLSAASHDYIVQSPSSWW